MTALRSTQRRNTMVMATITMVALLVMLNLSLSGVRALRRYEGATKVDAQLLELAPTEVAMLATVDETDQLTTVTVFVLTPAAQGQVGGSIVSVPVASDTGYGIEGKRIPLTEVYEDGGEAALGLAVEGLLGITMDHWEVANAPASAALLAPLGEVTVDLPTEVAVVDDDVRTVLYPAGSVRLSPSGLVEVLEATIDRQPEALRRGNVEAVWRAVAVSVGDGIGGVSASEPIESLADVVARLFAGPIATRGLATAPIDPKDNPEGKDVVALDRADAVMVFASIAPNSTSQPAPGLVYRIEAPPGYEERVRAAVAAVLYFDQNVQSVYVSTDVPLQAQTELVLYDDRFEERTEETATIFGDVAYVKPTVKIAGVDAVLRLGTSFLLQQEPTVLPSTTTTTP